MSQAPLTAPNLRARARPQFLASVTSAGEAEAALAGGAEIIDCKNPSAGALGALPLDMVRAIRAVVPQRVLLSATIGDLAAEPAAVTAAAKAMAETGVDYVKIGFFPGGDAKATIRALGNAFSAPSPRGARGRLSPAEAGRGAPSTPVVQNKPADAPRGSQPRIVGLLLADRAPDFSLIADMAAAGFAGVMLDTADKKAGGLPKVMPVFRLSLFVKEAHRCGLFAGLAGSLRLAHIPQLAGHGADILGFRGALCRSGERTAALDPRAVDEVAKALRGLDHTKGGLAREEHNRA